MCAHQRKKGTSVMMILAERFEHGHVEEEDKTIERHALRQTCKQKAVKESCKSPNCNCVQI